MSTKTMSSTLGVEMDAIDAILRDCVMTLESVAGYSLPETIDQRLLWLAENKERLDEPARQELLSLSEFAEARTLEKVKARAVLQRIAAMRSQLVPD